MRKIKTIVISLLIIAGIIAYCFWVNLIADNAPESWTPIDKYILAPAYLLAYVGMIAISAISIVMVVIMFILRIDP